MATETPALVYGATGYTGRLIARMAAGYGLRPVLAGRSGGAVAALAGELGLEHRAFSLDDSAAVRDGLSGMAAVLHCAGPFAQTYGAMADACLAGGVHYLDITGEIEVFEALAARDAEARVAGVMLLPGVGFDVVPTDCLAAHLKRRLPTATRLQLAIKGSGRLSHGTANTMVENMHRGGVVRRAGRLVRVPAAWRTREVDFGRGPRTAVTIPWGDVSTAYHSTGIPDVEVYSAVSGGMRRMMAATRYLGWLLRNPGVRATVKRILPVRANEPDDAELAAGRSFVWGRVEDAEGRSAVSRLAGPDGYLLTAHAALLILRRTLEGTAPAGFQTPSRVHRPDLVLEVPGIEREDVE
jgi:short subunit dehydrogenase-like uncharacterized protein